MVKLVHVTDTHLCPPRHIPQARTEQYHEHCIEEWQNFVKLCDDHKADAIIHSGDLLHIKPQDDYTPGVIEYLRKNYIETVKLPVYIIPGNHDLPRSDFGSITRTAFHILTSMADNWHDLSLKGSYTLVPGKVAIHGIPYLPLKNNHLEGYLTVFNEYLATHFPNTINIVLVHPDALPGNSGDFSLPWPTLGWEQLGDYLSNGQILCLGHIHQQFPIGKRHPLGDPNKTQLILKPWSFGRNVHDEYVNFETLEKRHQPTVSIIDINTETMNVDVKYEVIPHIPFDRAFNRPSLHDAITQASKLNELAGLFTRLKDSPTQFTASSIDTVLAGVNMPAADLTEEEQQKLARIRALIDKPSVLTALREVLNEAETE